MRGEHRACVRPQERDVRRDARLAVVDPDVVGLAAELRRELLRVEGDAPATVGGRRVVRIGDGREVRQRLTARIDVLHRGRAAARVGVVRGADDPSAVAEHLAGGVADGFVRRRLLGDDAGVDLAAAIGIQVEGGTGIEARHRI